MWIVNEQALIILGVALAIVGLVTVSLLIGPQPPDVSDTQAVATTESTETIQNETSTTTTDAAPEAIPPAQPTQEQTADVTPPAETPSSSGKPVIDGTIHSGEYAHAMEASGFQVYWTNDQSLLYVGLHSPGTGYLAIGFDPESRMRGANFILCAVKNGHVVTRDDYGTGPLSHASDVSLGGQNNVLNAAGSEFNGETSVEFIIPLDSGDPQDKVLSPGETYSVLVAYHNTSDDFSTRHSQRGVGEIRLD